MLLKLIRCRVGEASRAAFARGQSQWAALAACDGFRGQVGGWCLSESELAVIVALWRDETSYEQFLRGVHDPIFDASGQRDSFDSIDVSLWEPVLPISGVTPSMVEALPHAGAVRIARCQVHPDRHEPFFETQRGIWNPGMESMPGMLGGDLLRSTSAASAFLVCTCWANRDAYDVYLRTIFPTLRARANVERDCAEVTGWVVGVEATWRVLP